MGVVELLSIGVGLAMDAFAVAVGKGLSMKRLSLKNAGLVGFYFGFFQALMPVIGYFLGIGFKDYFNKGGVTIIEWADLIEKQLPKNRLEIKFKVIDEDTRVLVFTPYGEEYEELCSAVL